MFVWCVGFAYATVLALAFQKLILPLLPNLHAQHGLLQNDAIHFHEVAAAMAEKIRAVGWSAWRLYPETNSSANVGLLAALYALLGADPAWFIPVNAAAHALGATMLYRMGLALWPGAIGRLGGLATATLFIAFPSALQWYGQNHRDAFAIAGSFLILYPSILLWSIEKPPGPAFWRSALLHTSAGVVLTALVRPHMLQVMVAGLGAGWLVVFLRATLGGDLRRARGRLASFAALIVIVAAGSQLAPNNENFNKIVNLESVGAGAQQTQGPGTPEWQWHRSKYVPSELDGLLQQLSVIRAHFAYEGRNAGSLLDGDRLPDHAGSAAAYFPRALLAGLFAPFPDTWTVHPTPVRLLGAMETLIWYLLAPGILLFAWYRPSNAFLVGLTFAAVLLAILGYSQPVVGTLYRERFGIWLFVALLGMTGWSLVLRRLLTTVDSAAGDSSVPERNDAAATAPGMTGLAAAGAAVLIVTFLTFFGFVIRDLILVKTFGMTSDLGGFFSAAMLPMFFVTFLSFPFADAMTKRFLELPMAARQEFVQSLLGVACALLFGTGLAVALFAKPIVAVVMSTADASQVDRAAWMLRCFTPILMFSGWTVIGNAVLNLNHRARAAAIAQITVPIIAIASIWLLYDRLGVYAAIVGMLLGMTVNVALVFRLTRDLGIALLPARRDKVVLRPVLENYMLLALAAIFTAATVPLNYAFAGTLDAGSISIWAFGSKMVQLVSGMAGVAIGAVVLPHLGRLVAGRRTAQLESDTFFLLIGGTWIGIFCALTVDLFAEPLVVLLLEGGKVSHAQSLQLARILSLGALQLPATIVSVLVLKLAAVSGSSWRAVLAAAVGFAVNAVGDKLLTPWLGLLGIAIASTMAAALAAALLMILTRKRSGIPPRKFLAVFAGWGIMIGLSVSYHFHSDAALAATLIAFAVVAWASWKQLSRKHALAG